MGAPVGIHPDNLIRSTQGKSFVPRHRIPFLSKAITEDDGRIYSQLSVGLQDVFGWITRKVIQLHYHLALHTKALSADRAKPSRALRASC